MRNVDSPSLRPPHRVQFAEVFTAVSTLSRVPRYVQVLSQLENAITRGRLVPGDTLPIEQQFCEGFGVARSTLRRAMDDLERRGIISRRQGSGTRVEQSPVIGYHPETSRTVYEAITMSQRQPRSVVKEFSLVDVDDGIAASTGFSVGVKVMRIVRERYANDAPIAGLENYVLLEAVTFQREDMEDKSLDAILRSSGWSLEQVEYDVRACPLDSALAGFMQLPAGTPVLQERRRAYHDGVLFSSGCNTYHPENHQLRGIVDNSVHVAPEGEETPAD